MISEFFPFQDNSFIIAEQMFTEKIFVTHFLMEREEYQEEDKERDAVP